MSTYNLVLTWGFVLFNIRIWTLFWHLTIPWPLSPAPCCIAPSLGSPTIFMKSQAFEDLFHQHKVDNLFPDDFPCISFKRHSIWSEGLSGLFIDLLLLWFWMMTMTVIHESSCFLVIAIPGLPVPTNKIKILARSRQFELSVMLVEAGRTPL